MFFLLKYSYILSIKPTMRTIQSQILFLPTRTGTTKKLTTILTKIFYITIFYIVPHKSTTRVCRSASIYPSKFDNRYNISNTFTSSYLIFTFTIHFHPPMISSLSFNQLLLCSLLNTFITIPFS